MHIKLYARMDVQPSLQDAALKITRAPVNHDLVMPLCSRQNVLPEHACSIKIYWK